MVSTNSGKSSCSSSDEENHDPLCTFTVTGCKPHYQAIYVCHTCTKKEDKDDIDHDTATQNNEQNIMPLRLCFNCAKISHEEKGHEIEYTGDGPSYCCSTHQNNNIVKERYPKLQVESDGYMKSFTIEERQGYKNFFDAYGFVVIRDVISESDCETSIGEVWESLQEKNQFIDRNNPQTWSEEYWPKDICRNGGFVNKFPYWKRMTTLKETLVAKQLQAWKNRENSILYNIFCKLMSTSRLWGSVDRYGVMRPSNHEQLAELNENWATKKEWLHWDLSPFHYGTSAAGYAPKKKIDFDLLREDYGSLRVQALIALTDGKAINGGFHCIPGFHHQFFEWRENNIHGFGAREEISRRNFIEVPDDDEMRAHICQVPMPAGSLLIWNSMLPHGNFPNMSQNQFRMVQYIKMIPVDDPREFQPAVTSTKFEKNDWFPQDYELSDLGKCIFGLKDWDE
jgi:ectoine hydroxylase-related dioxygenase (phytanoyl-CoA dioxygenase family)